MKRLRTASPINVPLILASSSPRRIELLKQIGLQIVIRPPETDETPRPREAPAKLVARLAKEKANCVMLDAIREFGAALIISADTIVVAPGGKKILGKPADEDEAFQMLKLLVGKTHVVHTAYCLLSAGREMAPSYTIRVVSSKVTMRKLKPEMIRAYIQTGEPMDKAGAYAAQGLGMSLIETIHGSYTNVVGLPMAQLLMDLEAKYGITPFRPKKMDPATLEPK